jgi:hypothetical protein
VLAARLAHLEVVARKHQAWGLYSMACMLGHPGLLKMVVCRPVVARLGS